MATNVIQRIRGNNSVVQYSALLKSEALFIGFSKGGKYFLPQIFYLTLKTGYFVTKDANKS